MKAILFGATDMFGQGVLQECLIDPSAQLISSIGRRASGRSDPKLRDLVLLETADINAVVREGSSA